MTHLGSPHEVYEYIKQIGDGSFGTVHKARNKATRKPVAIKVMKKKYTCLEDCETQFEPKLLDLLPPHINIVQLYDSFLTTSTSDLSFVMEYMDGGNLYQLMRERKRQNLPFNNRELRSILYQVLSAVSHIHHHNIFHRDMKPENLLLDYSSGRPILKLADFGLAREINSQPPYTEYVSTRWYRAPEVLLRSTEYTAAVDLWALGAIFAELILLEPLFPGESEIDQIYKICEILGSPGNKVGVIGQRTTRVARPEKKLSPGFARKKIKDLNNTEMLLDKQTISTISKLDGGGEWKEGVKLAYKIGFKFPQLLPKPLDVVIPNATKSMLDLIQHFLFFNPQQRRSADAALKHGFFTETEEPVHTIVPFDLEPITPPNLLLDITPLDLLKIPSTPYEVCPDWNTEHPVSRYGRVHEDSLFLQSPEPVDENAFVTQSRPIYSSHQNKRPLTGHDSDRPIYSSHANDLPRVMYDPLAENRPIYSSHDDQPPLEDRPIYSSHRPNSSQIWNPYMYASYRPGTPKVEHVSSSHSRHSSVSYHDEKSGLESRRSSTHLLHHYHHPHHNDYYERQLSHQLIKWTPPHFVQHPRYNDEEEDTVLRPESRQSNRSSTDIITNKYTSSDAYQPIGFTYKTPPPLKPSVSSHRLNLWVPKTEDNKKEEEGDAFNDRWIHVL